MRPRSGRNRPEINRKSRAQLRKRRLEAADPAIFIGTSSDRIGSPEGTQSYFLTGAKHLWRLPLSVYASMNYSEWDEGMNFPFGVNVELPLNFSLRPVYDGDRSHLMLTHYYRQLSFSLLYVWYERLGAAMSVGF